MARNRDKKTGADGAAADTSAARAKGSSRPAPRSARVRPTPGGKTQKSGSYTKDVQTGRSRKFVTEVVAEMKKVSWPTRTELLQATVVVIIAVAIMAAFLGLADQASRVITDWMFPK